MNHRASGRALVRLAGWALPIFAGLFLAPTDARAACGDYVTTRLSHAEQATAASHELPAAPRPPCNGPGCKQAPVAPIAPAPSLQPPTSQEWGWSPDAFAPVPPGLAAIFSARDAPRPTRLPRPIFHPPRRAS